MNVTIWKIDNVVIECTECDGNGMGPIKTQQQISCPYCNGKGTSMHENDKCQTGNGNGLNQIQKTYDFITPRCSKHGEKNVFKSHGHEI